jgi:predicted DCC family thiol-disulfide oxidoreductase YuxK
MSSEPSVPLIVYFDGECPVCSREIALYRRQAGAAALAWVDATSCPAAALGADLPRPAALARLHVRTADGRLRSGAAAFTALWCSLPRFAPLGRLLSRRPFPALLEIGYRGLLVVRRVWRRPRAPTHRASRW